MKIIKIIFYIILISLNSINHILAEDFNKWKISFKDYAIKKGISKKTLDMTLSKVKFLPKVIEYDRYQPEFYEDTNTYISKRTSNDKVKIGKDLFIIFFCFLYKEMPFLIFDFVTLLLIYVNVSS